MFENALARAMEAERIRRNPDEVYKSRAEYLEAKKKHEKEQKEFLDEEWKVSKRPIDAFLAAFEPVSLLTPDFDLKPNAELLETDVRDLPVMIPRMDEIRVNQ